MRILLVTLCVLLLVLSATPSNVAVGNWVWEFEDSSGEYYVFNDAYYNNGGSTDAFDGFFYMFLDPAGTIFPASGGVTSANLIYSEPSGEFKVFKYQLPNPYLGAIITTTARIDDGPVSWGSVFQEFYNPGATPVSLYLNSLQGGSSDGDNRGSDGNTRFIATSNGDNAFTQADSWSVSYQASGGHDPVEITAFGEAGLLDYLKEYNADDNIHWVHTITIPPQKTVGFLRAVGLVNYYYAGSLIPAAKVVAQNAAVAAVNSATTFYTYQNPLGNRLLSHLSASQLLSVVNWDFLSAGVGGDPHGVHFDGTLFELPGSPAIYCLFADDRHQVNLKVARSGFVTQVVVISHLHGIRVSAEIDEFDNIEYLVDDRQIGVPVMFDIIETRDAPLNFRSDPLNQLERYHQSALMIRNLVTIVGGIHPTLGGFFNVAVHTRPNHSTHPTLLQLPSHPLRDVGFSVAVIPRIDFTF